MHLYVLLFYACLLGSAERTLSSEPTTPAQASSDEHTIWNLEHAYWRYVETNDLTAYSSLWHEDFLGWPSVSSSPVRKDHITDWITSQTSKAWRSRPLNLGLPRFKSLGTWLSHAIG